MGVCPPGFRMKLQKRSLRYLAEVFVEVGDRGGGLRLYLEERHTPKTRGERQRVSIRRLLQAFLEVRLHGPSQNRSRCLMTCSSRPPFLDPRHHLADGSPSFRKHFSDSNDSSESVVAGGIVPFSGPTFGNPSRSFIAIPSLLICTLATTSRTIIFFFIFSGRTSPRASPEPFTQNSQHQHLPASPPSPHHPSSPRRHPRPPSRLRYRGIATTSTPQRLRTRITNTSVLSTRRPSSTQSPTKPAPHRRWHRQRHTDTEAFPPTPSSRKLGLAFSTHLSRQATPFITLLASKFAGSPSANRTTSRANATKLSTRCATKLPLYNMHSRHSIVMRSML